jgi:hypothetical protein
MPDSLNIAGLIELVGGSVATIPQCPGAQFWLDPAYDLGVAQPVADVNARFLLDGEIPTGYRASNRTMNLPMTITAPDRDTLVAAREYILQLTDAQFFPITWTREGGMPLTFDCFRAHAPKPNYSITDEQQLACFLTLEIPALPYGHSADPIPLIFQTSALGQAGIPAVVPPQAVTIDDFTSVSSANDSSHWSQSSNHATAKYSAKWDYDNRSNVMAIYDHTLAADVNISGLQKLSFWTGFADEYNEGWHPGNVVFTVDLYDASGHHMNFGATVYCSCSDNEDSPKWNQITISIPSSSTFDFTHLHRYILSAQNHVPPHSPEMEANTHFNHLQAVPTTTYVPPSLSPANIRGNMYQLLIDGTARAPLSVQANRPSQGGSPAWYSDFEQLADATTITAGNSGGTNEIAFNSVTVDGTGSTLTASASAAIHGGMGMRCVTGASGTPHAYGTYVVGPNDEIWARSNVTLRGTPAAGENLIWYGYGNSRSFKVAVNSGTRAIAVNNASSTIYTFTNIPSVGTPFRVETHYCYDTGVIDVWLYLSADSSTPTETYSTTAQNVGTSISDTVRFGSSNGQPSNVTIDYDDIAVSVISKIGPVPAVSRTFSTYGDISFTPPAGVSAGDILLTGAGGRGGRRTTAGQGGGGKAGQFSRNIVYPLTAGVAMSGRVGKGGSDSGIDGGDSWFGTSDGSMTAYGGKGVADNTASGQTLQNGTPTSPIHFDGGDGGSVGVNQLSGQDAGFEGGIGHWAPGSNCSLAYSTAQARTGSGAMRYTATSAATGYALSCLVANILTQGNPVSPGDSVTVTIYGKWVTGTAKNATIGIDFYDNTGTIISGSYRGSGVLMATGSWTAITYSVTAPANSYRYRTSPSIGSPALSDVCDFDDPDCRIVSGGGGGAAASPAGDGADAVTTPGAIGPSGDGGNGATGGGNNAGSNGTAPGGAGGGAVSTGGTAAGGLGADGQVIVNYIQQLSPFHSLILHRPGPEAPPSLIPFTAVGSGADPPDSREYAIASALDGVNARFKGTYSIYLIVSAWDSATLSAARTVTVTVNEYEYPGGPVVSRSVQRTLTPNTETDIANGIVCVGELTLPVSEIASDNTASYPTVEVLSDHSADRFLDVLFLDTVGQTTVISIPSGNGYCNFYLDEPEPNQDIGRVLGSSYGRAEAISVMASCPVISGGPLTVDPGLNTLLVYSPEGLPGIVASYKSRWRVDRN